MCLTPLMCAVTAGDVKTIRRRVAFGRDLRKRDKYGQTALMIAASAGDTEAIKCLLDSKKGLQDKEGWTALMCAASDGHVEAVRLSTRTRRTPCSGRRLYTLPSLETQT